MSVDISLVDLVLQRVRASADPPPGSATRVLSGVERQIAGSAPDQHDAGTVLQAEGAPQPEGAPPAALSSPLAAAPRGWAAHVVRLGRWVVFGLAAGGVGYSWGSRRAAPAPAEHAATAPLEQQRIAPSIALLPPPSSAPAQPGSVPPPTPEPKPEPQSARSEPDGRSATEGGARRGLAQARRRAAASPPEPLELHEALQLLSRAQSVLRRGWPERAIELLLQLEQRQPGELLLEERLVTRILALCALGEVDQAQAVRRQLGPARASSIYAGRLGASCTGVEHTITD